MRDSLLEGQRILIELDQKYGEGDVKPPGLAGRDSSDARLLLTTPPAEE
jgi:hypothetical protein